MKIFSKNMTELINNLVNGWKKELLENKDIEKLWDFYELLDDEEGELVIQVKEDWEAYINVYQIVISISKLEFEDTQKPFSPFLSVRRSAHILEYKRFDKLDDMEKIMEKIEDFTAVLPVLPIVKEEEEEEKKNKKI